MRKALFALFLVPALAAGCTTTDAAPDTAAAPVVTVTPTLPAAERDRAACHALSEAPGAMGAELDSAVSQPVADLAIKADDQALRAAGHKLAASIVVPENTGEKATWDEAMASNGRNIEVTTAWLAVASACGDLYGDGPW
jgi:hypothetical protein